MPSHRAIFGLSALLGLTPGPGVVIPLNSTTGVTLVGVKAAAVSYRGRDTRGRNWRTRQPRGH